MSQLFFIIFYFIVKSIAANYNIMYMNERWINVMLNSQVFSYYYGLVEKKKNYISIEK